MKKILTWLLVVRLSLRWARGLHLGTQVIHRGEVWTIYQGNSAPWWGLTQGGGVTCKAHESKIQKRMTPANIIGDVRSGYRFYMGAWFDIWCRHGIEPWMLPLHIWAGRTPKVQEI